MDESGAKSMEALHFFYDAQSRPAFVEYNSVKYRYIHNLQGDIVGIVDSTGVLAVEYRYDATIAHTFRGIYSDSKNAMAQSNKTVLPVPISKKGVSRVA